MTPILSWQLGVLEIRSLEGLVMPLTRPKCLYVIYNYHHLLNTFCLLCFRSSGNGYCACSNEFSGYDNEECVPREHLVLFLMQEASRYRRQCMGWPARSLSTKSQLYGSWLYDLRKVITSLSLFELQFFIYGRQIRIIATCLHPRAVAQLHVR